MDATYMSKQPATANVSKKNLTEVLQLKLANSVDEYHLKGKKFKNALEKASKALASLIAKQDRKKKKAKE